jgi:hypothetical protein
VNGEVVPQVVERGSEDEEASGADGFLDEQGRAVRKAAQDAVGRSLEADRAEKLHAREALGAAQGGVGGVELRNLVEALALPGGVQGAGRAAAEDWEIAFQLDVRTEYDEC